MTTLVIHPDEHRVLMGRRSSVGAFANELVFPGGVVDPIDATNAGHADTAHLDVAERTRRVAAARELREETAIRIDDLSAMGVISRWITPEGMPARFDTSFYVLELPRWQEPEADGVELTSLEWVDPVRVVEACQAGEMRLLLPTLAHLAWLAEQGPGWRQRITAEHEDPRPILPELIQTPDGRRIVRIRSDAGFPITETPVPQNRVPASR